MSENLKKAINALQGGELQLMITIPAPSLFGFVRKIWNSFLVFPVPALEKP